MIEIVLVMKPSLNGLLQVHSYGRDVIERVQTDVVNFFHGSRRHALR
jgi:hypothetical protein